MYKNKTELAFGWTKGTTSIIALICIMLIKAFGFINKSKICFILRFILLCIWFLYKKAYKSKTVFI
jgi:hypothetical protein